jgi:UDP-3-O-[3-hydroxymyristoyl] N-acetylglucosamine deacetylase/3-hydroxyacyl-[acyl-carrier-protein] dehydratase
MPGVLQVEAMAQVASILMLKMTKSGSGRLGYFVSADEVKFRKPVFPGDTLVISAELTKTRGKQLAKLKCSCAVNDSVVSECELMLRLLDQ